jgi:hypothetical protein
LYTAPPNEYLIRQPRLARLTNQELLTVFYAHVLELARLLQASEVPQNLDPVEITRSKDSWSWSVSLPMQVEKLWADLQAVRKQVARALAANARAAAGRAEGRQHLAGMFVFRLLEIADHLPPGFVQRIPVLSRDAEVATNIRRAWQAGAYQRALAKYFKAQIAEELHALGAAEPPVRSRL